MNEEMKSQKEEFLLEVQKQILHKGLKSEMQEMADSTSNGTTSRFVKSMNTAVHGVAR